MPSEFSLILQGGAIGVFLLVFLALLRGDLRTKQEVEAVQKACDRANAQVDTLLPATQKLTETVGKQNDMLEDLLRQLADEVEKRVVR